MSIVPLTGLSMTHPASNNHYLEEEITLRELATALWRSKVFISVIILIMAALAAAYAYTSTPMYQVRVVIEPPKASELTYFHRIISGFRNAEASVHRALHGQDSFNSTLSIDLTSDSAYNFFTRSLGTNTTKQVFFNNFYFPEHSKITPNVGKQESWTQFNQNLDVPQGGNPQNPSPVTITMRGNESEKISGWLNQYVQVAHQIARAQLADSLTSIKNAYLQEVDTSIDSLKALAAVKRMNEISRLQDALIIAEATGITTPLSSGSLVASYKEDTLFLRGSEAIKSEIELLRSRKDDTPYISELPNLLYAQALLTNLSIDPDQMSLASIEEVAIPPSSPVSPRKKLLILLGAIIGLIVGTVAALVRHKLTTRRVNGSIPR